MIIYLRTQKNKTLVDISVYNQDLHSVVRITNYSTFLIQQLTFYKTKYSADKKQYKNEIIELVSTFDDLQELRGWLHERYMATENKNPTDEEIEKEVIKKLKPICKKYSLNIVTD